MQKQVLFKNSPIYFSDVGTGNAIVLLHGFLENSSMWNATAQALSKKNRVITIDLLGHGNTPSIGYVHSMDLFAESIATVLKFLKIRRFIMIGHSLGGYVALEFSKQNSETIKGLCLLNASAKKDSNERKKRRTRATKMAQQNLADLVRLSFTNLFAEASKSLFQKEIKHAINEALKISLQSYMATQEGMKLRLDSTKFLKESNFKKLYVIGKSDPIIEATNLVEEAKNTNASFVELSGGHMSTIENKKELIAVLQAFISVK